MRQPITHAKKYKAPAKRLMNLYKLSISNVITIIQELSKTSYCHHHTITYDYFQIIYATLFINKRQNIFLTI